MAGLGTELSESILDSKITQLKSEKSGPVLTHDYWRGGEGKNCIFWVFPHHSCPLLAQGFSQTCSPPWQAFRCLINRASLDFTLLESWLEFLVGGERLSGDPDLPSGGIGVMPLGPRGAESPACCALEGVRRAGKHPASSRWETLHGALA